MNASIEPNNARSEERLIAFIHALIAAVLHEHQPSAIAALPAVCSQRSPYAISLNAAFAQENQFNMTRPCRVPKGEQLSCILFVLRAEIVVPSRIDTGAQNARQNPAILKVVVATRRLLDAVCQWATRRQPWDETVTRQYRGSLEALARSVHPQLTLVSSVPRAAQ